MTGPRTQGCVAGCQQNEHFSNASASTARGSRRDVAHLCQLFVCPHHRAKQPCLEHSPGAKAARQLQKSALKKQQATKNYKLSPITSLECVGNDRRGGSAKPLGTGSTWEPSCPLLGDCARGK